MATMKVSPDMQTSRLPEDAATLAPLCAVFRRYLRSRRLKYTPERADILNAIIENDDVFEVEQLMHDLRGRGLRVSKATIYRTIKLLQEAGIITQALFDAKQTHYRLIYGRKPHNDLVCVETGTHHQFTCDELEAIIRRVCREHGWAPVGHRFQIYAVSPEGEARRAESDGA